MKVEAEKEFEDARYSDVLANLLNSLGTVEILRKDYDSDLQGHVDVDALLEDGRVFSYRYSYGSCSGCDDWEDRGLTDEQIRAEMLQDGTFAEDIDHYQRWRQGAIDKTSPDTR